MKKLFTVFINTLLLVVFFSTTTFSALKPIEQDTATKMKVVESFGKLPLSFIENRDQINSKVFYYLKGKTGTIYFTKEGIVYDLIAISNSPKGKTKSPSLSHNKSKTCKRLSFTMKPIGANKNARLTANNKLSGQVNYLIGNNPKKWHKEIPLFKEIIYKDLYKDIDLKIYGNNNQMEYDFIVSPGADPKVITIACEGIDALSVDKKGDLLIKTPLGELKHLNPLIYQEIRGKRYIVNGSFVVAENTFSFNIKEYDKDYPLIIDPLTLSYSTYLGGSDLDEGLGIAVDSSGSAYVTGWTASSDFPTENAYQSTGGGFSDVFVTKFNPTGSSLSYSTYLGGSSAEDDDQGNAIAVDSSGNAYITGYTDSSDFPMQNAYQSTYGGGDSDAFVTKLDSTGSSLSYSTYLGGSDGEWSWRISVDSSGSAYVTGWTASSNFPTQNAYQSTYGGGDSDAFVTKFEPSGTSLSYSTYLGGSNFDEGLGIAVDSSGSAYVTGWTTSSDFPIQNAYQSTYGGGGGDEDAFVTKFNPTGSSLSYSTYLGGSGAEDHDQGNAIAVDSSGNAYITGYTDSSDFPIQNAYQSTYGGGDSDAFVTKLNSTGSSLSYSTYLGGSGSDWIITIAVDSSGSAYVTGWTTSSDFPIQNAYQSTYGGGDEDAFVTKFEPDGTSLSYSTYLGGSNFDGGIGIALDSSESAYVTGYTASSDFPTQNAYQSTYGGGDEDAFVTKFAPFPINIQNNPPISDAGTDQTVNEGDTVTLDASNSTDPDDGIASYLWEQTNGPQVTLSSTTDLQPNFSAPSGIQNSVTITFQLTVTDNGGLQDTDTVVITVHLSPVVQSTPDGDIAPLGNPDGTVNVGDALVALRFALGLETPTQEDTIHGDVAPLDTNGQPQPDGSITVGDALVILRKALGLVDWTISKDTHTITTAGGTIELSNGATLDIPPNSAATPVEVLFTETPTPAHIGEEVIKAYAFVTDSELLTSDFTLPVETNDVTSGEDLLIVHMQRQIGPADPIDFTYDPSANTVNFSLRNNWTFQNIPGPAKNRYMNGNRNSNTPLENNKDNTLLVIKRSPYPTVTGKSGPIQMPFFEQGNAGTCWANCGKMLQKGLYQGYLGATSTYEVFQFMKMLNLGLEDGLYWDSKYSQFADVIGIGKGKAIKWEEYYSFSSALKEIIEQLNRGNPVIFTRLDHVVLVVGYENDVAGDLYLIQHNPQNLGTIGGLYQEQKWEDIATLWNWQDIIALTWAADIPDPKRALQSINLPGQDVRDDLYFRVEKTDGDPSRNLHLKFDETSIDGYRWQKSGSAPMENTNHFPKNVNQLFFEMPVYNADLNNSTDVTFGIKVYEKDDASNEVVFSKDIVIAPKNKSTVKGDLDLTLVRVNLEEESECVLYITLEKGTERTTSIPIDNFFLQPLELEITLSIPGASTNTDGNYEIVADGAPYTIKAEVKDKDGNNITDGTKVEFATTAGSLSAASTTTTNGEATVTLTSPTTIGSADITATVKEISGSATVKEISGSTKVDFIAGPIDTLTLSANPSTLPADGTSTSTIQITAKDINGNPVADESIGLTVSSGSLSAASSDTNENGIASVIYIAPGTAPPGGISTITATTGNAITATVVITINSAPSWEGWPDPQWCPQTSDEYKGEFFILYPDNNPGQAIQCDYFNNAQLEWEIPNLNGKKEGWRKSYFENGTLKYQVRYEAGEKTGIATWFYESGNIESLSPYVNDLVEGNYTRFYENGQTMEVIPFQSGLRNGTAHHYYSTGERWKDVSWQNDKRNGIEKEYYKNGQLNYEHPYTNGLKNGITKGYYENGQPKYETPYINGKKHGTEYQYYETGKLKSETPWVDDEINGIQREYYESGSVQYETPYTDDEKNGTKKEYYESGQLWAETPYVDDKKNGQMKLYDKDGELTSCTIYENNTDVGSCMP